MTDPCKNNDFAGSEQGDDGGFSANQSKPWRHGEHPYICIDWLIDAINLLMPDFSGTMLS